MLENLKEIDRSQLKLVYNVLSELALFVTIALAVALVIYAVVIRNRDEEYLAKSRKLMLGIVIGYAVSVIATIGTLMLLREIMGGLDMRFWLMFGLIALVCVGLVVTLVLMKRRMSVCKWVALGFVIAAAVYVVVLLCVVPPVVEDEGNVEQYKPLSWSMYLFSAILVAAIVTLSLVGSKPADYDTRAVTYGAVCVSLSFALSYIKFFSLPQGGSVTFASMLPLCLYSYMFGTRRGLIAGVVYGLLQFIQSPQFYQPMQVMLDYPIAFGALGLAGIARNFKFLKGNIFAEFTVGASIAIILRYFSHVISGYFVFGSYAMEGYTAISWAFVYNLFTVADLAIVLAVGLLALSARTVRRMIRNVQTAEAPQAAAE
ncbi:MAG: energy-coupled thiamine transporter ThiT [Corallococcus sp.]|nr:energy-coupled thiamine transporter ThiT [Corallococcus sp.]